MKKISEFKQADYLKINNDLKIKDLLNDFNCLFNIDFTKIDSKYMIDLLNYYNVLISVKRYNDLNNADNLKIMILQIKKFTIQKNYNDSMFKDCKNLDDVLCSILELNNCYLKSVNTAFLLSLFNDLYLIKHILKLQ